jgi:BASS family bile acid:Na+ symporter
LVLMLGVFPVVVYYLTLSLYPPLAIAFLLLSAMPSGMTAPLLTSIAGGKQSLALVLTVLTSLVAPFSIPILVQVLLGSTVAVDAFDMFQTLLVVIGVPFLLAHTVRSIMPVCARYVGKQSKGVSIVLLGLLVAGIVAGQAEVLLGGLSVTYVVGTLGALVAVFVLLHALGYVTAFWRSKEERIAISVCLTYMNFVLALYLGNEFFPEEGAVVPIICAIVPWVLLLSPFRYIVRRLRV